MEIKTINKHIKIYEGLKVDNLPQSTIDTINYTIKALELVRLDIFNQTERGVG